MRSTLTALTALVLLLSVTSCGSPPASATVSFAARDGSAVAGTVTLVAIDAQRTRVEIHVTATGFPDMPAHIHAGPCDDSIPQPRYPLTNVRDGVSVTDVGAPLAQLRGEPGSLNLHASNEDMRFITACADMEDGALAAGEPAGSHAHAGD